MDFKSGFSAVHVGEQIHSIMPSEAEMEQFYMDAQHEGPEMSEVKKEVVTLDQPAPVKKKKNKKKKKSISYDIEELSPFAQWLLTQRSISDERISLSGRDKSSKVKESAKKSIKASEDIISEPLAIILMKQGHYLESKKMFQKLSSRFPEKAEDYLRYISDINDMIDRKI